ncbi:MAG: TonB C-terminal domain-containing protein [Gemmatimonadota bacterium]
MTNSSHNSHRPGRGAITASLVLHVVFLVVAWLAHRAADQPIEYMQYEIQLVSMADLEVQEDVALTQPEELVVEEPDEPEIPEVVEEESDPIPDPIPIPEVEQEEVQEEEEEVVEEEVREEVTEQQQEEIAETTEEAVSEELTSPDIAVRMEGLQRDYPEYYREILAQIRACFRWQGDENWTTVLRFVISSDGRIPGGSIQRHRGSGHLAFDLAAVGAVECAGAGRISPLPADLPFDELPIQFTFSPQGGGGP